MEIADQMDELNPNKNRVKTELEPCDDCISRQAVLDALDNYKYFKEFCKAHHIDWSINLDMARFAINNLPPVTPKEKTGHWIEHPHECGLNWEFSMYECSNCHEWVENDYDYCPNCGVKMFEPQESEEV